MTDFYTNSLSVSAVGLETTYGTPPGTYSWFGVTQNFSVVPANETIKNRTQNLNRETFSIDILKQNYTGEVSWRVQDGSFFLAAFGTLNTVDNGDGTYTHTFDTGDSLLSYSLYNQLKGRGTQTDIIDVYTGCKTDEFKLSVSESEYLMATNTVLSNGKVDDSSSVIVTASIVKAYRFADATDRDWETLNLNSSVLHPV